MKRLYRSEKNRIIAGVCGGLGDYFGIDPTIIRLIFVALAMMGGSTVWIYIILWVVIPSESSVKTETEDVVKENTEELKERAGQMAKEVEGFWERENSRRWVGVALVLLGIMFVVSNFGIPLFDYIWKLWPLLFVVAGALILAK